MKRFLSTVSKSSLPICKLRIVSLLGRDVLAFQSPYDKRMSGMRLELHPRDTFMQLKLMGVHHNIPIVKQKEPTKHLI